MRYSNNLNLRAASIAIIAVLGVVAPVSASAQSAETEGAASADIIVTAERRQQSVLDVPVSIVALSGDSLRQRGVDDLAKLQSAVPSLSFVDAGSVKFFNVRGVGLSEAAPQQTNGVAVHLDGAYVAREFVFGDPLFDIASIEVLRGPQGTFQGQNASGGALYMNSIKPSLDSVEGYVTGEYGTYNHLLAGGAFNFPITSSIALRVSGLAEKRDSFNKNYDAVGQLTDTQAGSLNRKLGRIQLLFKPTSDFEFRLIEQLSEQKGGSPIYKTFALAGVEPDRESNWDVPTFLNTSYNRTTGVLDWNTNAGFRVHATLAYQKTTQHTQRDEDYTSPILQPGQPQSAARIDVADKYWTGEVNLISTTSSPFQWTIGASFLDYKSDSVTQIVAYNDLVSFPPSPGLTPDWNSGVYIPSPTFRRNQSAFGELSYHLTEQLEVKLGGRYNHDENGFPAGAYFTVFGPMGPVLSDLSTPTYSFNAFSGRAVINYKPSNDLLFYASVSRGYKPGGVAAPLFGFGGPYKSEFVLNYELGAKGRIPGVLNYSLAGFYMDYKGYQATVQMIPNVPPSRVTLNVDGTTVKGVEAQFDGSIRGLKWDVSGSILDTSFGSQNVILPAGAAGGGLPAGPTLLNIAGLQINYAPKFSMSGGLAYDFAVGELTITPSVRMSHMSSQWVSYLHLPYTLIPGHTTFDARLGVKAQGNWSVEGYVTNLGDRTYIANVNQTTNGIGGFLLGAPREAGVRVRFDF